jgi:hypothetical protein
VQCQDRLAVRGEEQALSFVLVDEGLQKSTGALQIVVPGVRAFGPGPIGVGVRAAVGDGLDLMPRLAVSVSVNRTVQAGGHARRQPESHPQDVGCLP